VLSKARNGWSVFAHWQITKRTMASPADSVSPAEDAHEGLVSQHNVVASPMLHDDDGLALYEGDDDLVEKPAADDVALMQAPMIMASPNVPPLSAFASMQRRSPISTLETAAATKAALDAIAGITPTPTIPQVRTTRNDGTSSSEGIKRKRKASPTNTSRKSKVKQDAAVRIRVGGRAKCSRKVLFHLLTSETQKACIRDFANNYQCYGTLKSGNSNVGYKVAFDILPAEERDVFVKRQNLDPVGKGEEEKTYERETDDPDFLAKAATSQKKRTPQQLSSDLFLELEDAVASVAKTFDMCYDNKDESNKIVWNILADNENISSEEDAMQYPDKLTLKKQIDFGDVSTDLGKIFFEHFFPDITGHGKLIDKYHSSNKSPYFITVTNEKIAFHDPENDDPDWIVKQAYLLLIAAANEAEVGVESLWKIGSTGGRRNYPDFGQYMPCNYFKAFMSAAAKVFGPEEEWYTDKRDIPWEAFTPALESFNNKRRSLFHLKFLMMDESMSGWRPKTSKLGGLPNISYEPRKPVPLGTMLRNAAECVTGCLVYQDISQNPEKQQFKEFMYENVALEIREGTSVPGMLEMPVHTAEVLRQCKGAGLEEGGWCGGDAWFGSVTSCVELKKRLNVHSTFVVKNNKHLYPMEVLHRILSARHGDKPAGHWVVMTTSISEVKLIAVAYAWSQKGVSYFISTCGSTETSPVKYESKFEDNWGNVATKLINRPELCHFLYEYLPLIDEHNKQRQNLLSLEKKWLTKDAWFRLICTLTGQSVVDMHRYHRHIRIMNGEERARVDKMPVLKYSDLICGSLRQWPRNRQRTALLRSDIKESLSRIKDKDGNITRVATNKQLQKGRTIGTSIVRWCFICRGYQDPQGEPIQHQTQWWCNDCHMPICCINRKDDMKFGPNGRDPPFSCLEVHQTARDTSPFGCKGQHAPKQVFPKEQMVNLHPRRSARYAVC
jgi:Transposase IS4